METIKKIIQDYLEVEGLELYYEIYLIPEQENRIIFLQYLNKATTQIQEE